MTRFMLAVVCIAGISGCDDTKATNTTGTNNPTASNSTMDKQNPAVDQGSTSMAGPVKPVVHDRDNSGVNVRDRDANAKTPLDQKNDKADIEITAHIRKRIVGSDMSTNAKNVKIITADGRVTLRGPVKSADEKSQIEKFAEAEAGADKVDNQLEIAK